ncbi:MAG: HAD family hydrolase [Candidatus Lokiarchaeota archaeon]|nr:HAD family hydrolase [Candidatus Harpocratesius repetitus]
MIKCISFDLWETLIKDHFQFEARTEILHQFLEKKGIFVSKKQVKNLYMEKAGGYVEFLTEENAYKHVPYQYRFRQFFQSFKLKVSEKEMKNLIHAFNQIFLDDPPEFYHEIIDLLPILAEKYKIILISDTGFTYGHVMRELLKRKKIIQYFSRCFFSDEIGHYKPHSKPFQMAESFIHCKPVEMVHIGDRIDTDILGANLRGWWSGLIQYNNENQKQNLKKSFQETKNQKYKKKKEKNVQIIESDILKTPNFIITKWNQLDFILKNLK